MARRIFVLGLDGGSWNVFEPLFAQGVMPHFQRLCEEGGHGPLTSTVPPITPVAWTTLSTGADPGRHGIFAFMKPRPDNSYFPVPVNRTDTQVPTIFDYYRDDPGFVCLNLPMSYPASELAGRMITGMMTPQTGEVASCHPPDLLDTIRALGIDYVIDPKLPQERSLEASGQLFTSWQAQRQEFLDRLARVTAARMQAVHHLLDTTPWSLFLCVIVGTDRLQHLFWDDLVPGDGSAAAPDLAAYYRAVDDHIGALRARLAPDDVLLLMSDHGFVRTHGSFRTNEWLRQRGWLAAREAARSPLYPLKRLLNRLGITRARLGRVLPEKQASSLQLRASHIDWARSQAYLSGPFAIRINVAGRETAGCVPPERKDALIDAITEALWELKDDAGRPMLADVSRADVLYAGDATAGAGDIVFTFRDELNYTAYARELGGELFRAEPGKTGDHRIDGIWAAVGGGVRAGEAPVRLGIADLLPTIMHLMGRPVPAICDGTVAASLFGDDRPVERDQDWRRFLPQARTVEHAPGQEAEIEARLKALGYLADDD